MHETSLMKRLLEAIETVAKENQARRVTKVYVTIGALANITPEHLREHFEIAVKGTLVEGAQLIARVSEEVRDSSALGVQLERVELEG